MWIPCLDNFLFLYSFQETKFIQQISLRVMAEYVAGYQVSGNNQWAARISGRCVAASTSCESSPSSRPAWRGSSLTPGRSWKGQSPATSGRRGRRWCGKSAASSPRCSFWTGTRSTSTAARTGSWWRRSSLLFGVIKALSWNDYIHIYSNLQTTVFLEFTEYLVIITLPRDADAE